MKNGPLSLSLKIGLKVGTFLLKFTKVGLVALSFAAYSYLFTWQFALILISALIIHEYGHYSAMKYTGMKTKGIYLIPFLGGVAVANDSYKTRFHQFFVAIAGPVFGLGSAIIPLILYWFTNYPLWLGIASWISLLNLFNLLPIIPLDGGQIVKSILFSCSRNLAIILMSIGLMFCLVLIFELKIWVLALIFLFGILDLYQESRNPNNLPKMIKAEVVGSSIAYITIITALLAIMLFGNSVPEANLALSFLQD